MGNFLKYFRIKYHYFLDSLYDMQWIPIVRLIFLMWLIFFLQDKFGLSLYQYGLRPRTLLGLMSLFVSPLIHYDYQHLFSNSLPLLLLGNLLYFFFPKEAPRVFLHSYFLPNIFVWIFARPLLHIGASGMIFALAFFIIFMGIFKKNVKFLILALFVLFLYGGLFYNTIFVYFNQSWETHVFGAMVGIANAIVFKWFKTHITQ